jgi:hypothetical protein
VRTRHRYPVPYPLPPPLPIVTICLFLYACGGSSPVPIPQVPESPRILSEEEQFDIELAVALSRPSDLKAMGKAADPAAWAEAFWARQDPDPETAENEALEVFRLRGRWLQTRCPDTLMVDLREPWLSFLRHGQWDGMLVGDIRAVVPDLNPSRFVAGVGQDSIIEATAALFFGSPEYFRVAILEGRIIAGIEFPKIPSLRRIWSTLENSRTSTTRKTDALLSVAWFETADTACRLLALPDSTLRGVEKPYQEALRRMAVRRAYLLGPVGARRLAAITAAGASPRLQLTRTLNASYLESLFLEDLASLRPRRGTRTSPQGRYPHPGLFERPAALLEELAKRYSDPFNPTGWDWRADLCLALGPPQVINSLSRVASYVYRRPERIVVNQAMLGAVDSRRIDDTLNLIVEGQIHQMTGRRAQARAAAEALGTMIPEASRATEALLDRIHQLLPPQSIEVIHFRATERLHLTADAVVFSDSTGTLDVMLSVGIPGNEVSLERWREGLRTGLRIDCRIVRSNLRDVWSECHEEGFLVGELTGEAEHRFLVDVFRPRLEPGDYLIYCSALEPVSGRSGGIFMPLELRGEETAGLSVSEVALAAALESESSGGFFRRGDQRIVLYPGRTLLYGQDIWLYYEIDGLVRSEYGDHVWDETCLIMADRVGAGIVKIPSSTYLVSLRPSAVRTFMIDLTEMAEKYEGPILIVILVTDVVGGGNAVTAARFRIYRP